MSQEEIHSTPAIQVGHISFCKSYDVSPIHQCTKQENVFSNPAQSEYISVLSQSSNQTFSPKRQDRCVSQIPLTHLFATALSEN